MNTEERKVIEQAITALRQVYINHSATEALRSLLEKPPVPFKPEGWQLVPKEPTEVMKRAAEAYKNKLDRWEQRTYGGYYRAMLEAAPKITEVE